MRQRTFSRLLGAVALAVAAGAANAAEVQLTGWAFGSGNKVQATGYVGDAGAFTGTLSNAGVFSSASFVTYCVELEEQFAFNADPILTYNLVDGASYFGNRRGNAQIAEKLGKLMTYVADHSDMADTAAESTSLQLAIWNIVYDTDYSVTTRGAFRDKSAYAAQADVLLAGLQAQTDSRYDIFVLERSGSQDMMLLAPRQEPVAAAAVPAPGTLALCVAGLAGWHLTRRRRTTAGV